MVPPPLLIRFPASKKLQTAISSCAAHSFYQHPMLLCVLNSERGKDFNAGIANPDFSSQFAQERTGC
jgi:hypothetical protein